MPSWTNHFKAPFLYASTPITWTSRFRTLNMQEIVPFLTNVGSRPTFRGCSKLSPSRTDYHQAFNIVLFRSTSKGARPTASWKNYPFSKGFVKILFGRINGKSVRNPILSYLHRGKAVTRIPTWAGSTGQEAFLMIGIIRRLRRRWY